MGDDDELRMLRRRAYGPDADIAGDDEALARLAALERRSRATESAADTAGAADDPVADAALAALGFGGDETDQTADETAAPRATEDTEASVTARRVRRRLVVACAATAVAVAAITVPATLGAAAFFDRPDAILHPVDREDVSYFESRMDDGSLAYDDFYGIEVVVGSFEGAPDTCLLLRLASDSGTGACSPPGLEPRFDVATRDGPRGVREEFGDDAALRFVVSGDDVLVYVVRPDPAVTPVPADPA